MDAAILKPFWNKDIGWGERQKEKEKKKKPEHNWFSFTNTEHQGVVLYIDSSCKRVRFKMMRWFYYGTLSGHFHLEEK